MSYISDETKKKKKELETAEAAKQAASTYTETENDRLFRQLQNQYLNTQPFSYDTATDPTYEMYKDRYTQLGKLAMEDSVGKAATMTGGYGNSYAQQVGQQTYNQYMSALADKAVDLEQIAYGRYTDRLAHLQNQISLAGSAADKDYSRWMDQYNILSDKASTARSDWQTSYSMDVDKYNIGLSEEANRIAAQQAANTSGTLSVEDYLTLTSEAEATAKKGNDALEHYLDGLGNSGIINSETWAVLYNRFKDTAESAEIKEDDGGNSTETKNWWNQIPDWAAGSLGLVNPALGLIGYGVNQLLKK